MNKALTLAFLTACSFGLTACPSKNKSSGSVETQIDVMGDPAEIIRGAQLNPEIEYGTFNDGERLALVSAYIFVEVMPLDRRTKIDLEAENSTSTTESSEAYQKAKFFTVRLHKEGIQLLDNSNNSSGLELVKRNGEYFANPGAKSEVSKLLHTSVSADRNTISLLVYSQNKATKRRQLMAFYFARELATQKISAQNSYEYYLGTGLKLPWSKKQPVRVGLCNNSYSGLDRMTRTAVSEWSKALGKNLSFSYVGEVTEYPPFSDLNFQCIYVVDSFRVKSNPYEANYAATYLMPDAKTAKVLDADIFIYKKEIAKDPETQQPAAFAINLFRATLHELGHFLGLGHQFNKTASIMSYEDTKTPRIEKHDVEAIRALYK